MNTTRILVAAYLLFSDGLLQGQTHPASGKSIPFAQLGAEAQKQYSGDGICVVPTKDGATIKAAFQRLEGRVTKEGLWLISTADEDKCKATRFRVRATAIGRETGNSVRLSPTGEIFATKDIATWLRPGLLEEYSASMDGIRQDFVVPVRPPGEGELAVSLELTGARAEGAASYGAKLTVEGSGRELVYSRLRVTDTNGRELPAWLEVSDARKLEVRVDDRGATYPVRIDPTFSDADWVSMGGLPGTDGISVGAIVVDNSGDVFIGGSFTVVADVVASNVAKWNGSSWSALGSGVNSSVSALAVDADGNLYAGGGFTSAGGVSVSRIAKWNGSSWSALGSGVDSTVRSLVVDGSGNLYAGGYFTTAGGGGVSRIAKWDGVSWSALGSGVNSSVYALAVDASGNLYAGGYFTTAGGANANNIARWNGSAWSALGSGVNSSVYALAVDASGNLWAGGHFTTAGGATANNIARWNGSAWSALGAGMSGDVSALSVDASGNLYAGGSFTTAGGVTAYYIARWKGGVWSALGSGMGGYVSTYVVALATDAEGNLFAGGGFTTAGGVNASRVARWNGSAWNAMGSGMNDYVTALAVDLASNLYAGGYFTNAGGVGANHVAKWNGSDWSVLDSGINGVVNALAMDSSGNLYAGGISPLRVGLAPSGLPNGTEARGAP